MRVCLISPFGDIGTLAIRQVSAVLKAAGHDVRMIFLTRERYGTADFLLPYEPHVLDGVVELCADAELIGITTMTNYVPSAIQLTRALKAGLPVVPVIWGGIHATSRPQECLEHADIAAIGEVDESLPVLVDALARGEDGAGCPGFHVRRGDEIIEGPVAPPPPDLDALPDADWDLEDDHALVWGELRRVDHDTMIERMWVTGGGLIEDFGGPTFRLMASRGCLYNCSFCCNNSYRQIFGGKWKVRERSLDRIMAEVNRAVARFPELRGIVFADDLFLGGRSDGIQPFARAYRDQVGLPFFCLYSPAQITAENMAVLVPAGLSVMEIGVQSGSKEISKSYHRMAFHRQLGRVAEVVAAYSDRLKPRYDFITDNPYETLEDLVETLRLVETLPKPNHLALFSLTLFPGTEIHQRAAADGLIDQDGRAVRNKYYMAKAATTVNLLLLLHRMDFSPTLLHWLGSEEVLGRLTGSRLERAASTPVAVGIELLRQHQDAQYQLKRMTWSRDVLGERSPVGQGRRGRMRQLRRLLGPTLPQALRGAAGLAS